MKRISKIALGALMLAGTAIRSGFAGRCTRCCWRWHRRPRILWARLWSRSVSGLHHPYSRFYDPYRCNGYYGYDSMARVTTAMDRSSASAASMVAASAEGFMAVEVSTVVGDSTAAAVSMAAVADTAVIVRN